MNISDFLEARSTHKLLYDLFASEIGLQSAAHPAVQVAAILEAFKPLQRAAAEGAGGFFEMSFQLPNGAPAGKAIISGVAEAKLFVGLYGAVTPFTQAYGTDALEDRLSQMVYPKVGRMLAGNPQMYAAVLAQLIDHCRHYGNHVESRILKVLPVFGLADMVPRLVDAVQTSPTAA